MDKVSQIRTESIVEEDNWGELKQFTDARLL